MQLRLVYTDVKHYVYLVRYVSTPSKNRQIDWYKKLFTRSLRLFSISSAFVCYCL